MNTGTGLDLGGGSATAPWLYVMSESRSLVTRRCKGRAGYLKRAFTGTQLATIHRHLTNGAGTAACGMPIVGHGGQVRAVDPGATAVAQRDVFRHALSIEPPEVWRTLPTRISAINP
ncbi:hypothetical protein [Kitasatospora griseola]|uniref:hypothetical protein n=1 Tax=Kitasatospora griseola TaxID=2064 RepID=UPI001671390F|nr:hypothetical protein [Kitasatospora griseola]GGQ68241.1 hypothetical protein GCM10010195_24910 [Kitasatospora griseola]